jgi:aminoglycoside phosphotransferase (APT) family kinase protein
MSLPELRILRSTFIAASGLLAQDKGLAMQTAVVTRMLDRMIVEAVSGERFIKEFYAALAALLPEVESALGPQLDAVEITKPMAMLKRIVAGNNTENFAQFLEASDKLQQCLLARATPDATAAARRIVGCETQFSDKFINAVVLEASARSEEDRRGLSVRNTKELDSGVLRKFLVASFPDEHDLEIAACDFIPGGYSKFTTSIMLKNVSALPEQVIMRGDAGFTFGGASVVAEYPVIKTLYEHGACVPKPLLLESSGAILGSPFFLVAKCPGVVLQSQVPNIPANTFNLPAKADKVVCADIAARIAAVHRVPAQLFGAIEGASALTSERALTWVDTAFTAWKALDMPSPTFEMAFEWLRRNASINDRAPRTLVHGDFGLNNMLIHDNKVSAILDWEYAHIGNPAYDLAFFRYQAESLSSWIDFLQAYGDAGAPVPEEIQLDYNVLLAAVRMGTMICQSLARFNSGGEGGILNADIVGGSLFDISIQRMSEVLQRVR